MTKFLHVLSGLIIWILFALLGGALIYANGLSIENGILGHFNIHDAWLEALCLGGFMIFLLMLYLLTFAPRRSKVRYISFDSGNGSVSISANAVRDYIRKLSGEFSAVVSIDPKVRSEKDSISLDLNVNLVAGVRIPELSQALQSRVRESLRDGLGIDEVKEVRVRVQEITGEPRSTRRN